MRRRSNAIHSDSTQEFLLLAELSQDAPGYFYDDKIREEIDRKISKKKPLFPNPQQIYQPKLQGFDFNSEIQCAMEEKRQLQSKGQIQVLQLAIKTNDVKQLKSKLALVFTPELAPCQQDQGKQKQLLDIMMVTQKDILLKIWMVSCEQNDSPLLAAYTNERFSWNYNPSQGKNLQHFRALLQEVITDLWPKISFTLPLI